MKSCCLLFFCILVTGCATYYIPIESFKHQFADIDSTKLRKVAMEGAVTDIYLANPIDTIDCVDSDNKPVRLANSPSIEIRFTDRSDDRTIFYFDTVYLQDSLIFGARSRFLPGLRDILSLRNIKLIEIQDGKKDFHYANPHN